MIVETFLGSTIEGEPLMWQMENDPHLIVAGYSGSGKTNFLRLVARSALNKGMHVHVASPSAADYRDMADHVETVDDTVGSLFETVQKVTKRMEEYQRTCAEEGAARISEVGTEELAHTVLIVDEVGPYLSSERVPEVNARMTLSDAKSIGVTMLENAQRQHIASQLSRLMREGRSAGIHVVLSGQRMGNSVFESVGIPMEMRLNASRVLFGATSSIERMVALREADKVPVITPDDPRGTGVFEDRMGRSYKFLPPFVPFR